MRVPIAALVAFSLASCATRAPIREGTDVAGALPREAAAYIRAGNGLLTEAAGVLLDPGDLKGARAVLDRTDRVTACLILGAAGQGTAPDMAVYGIAEGSYPAGAATFRMRLSRAWRKEGRELVSRGGGVRMAFAGRNLLVAGNRDLEPLLERLGEPRVGLVPGELRPLWEAEGAILLARPDALLARWMGPDAPSIPAQGILLSLTRPEGSEPTGAYEGTEVFLFPDERSARVFGPLCRLAHLAFVRAVYGPDSDGAEGALQATRWETRGDRVLASGFTVRSRDLVQAVGRALGSGTPE